MRYGSVCSGIEAATVAWHPLGWEAAWLAEIEPFPCAVLAHHYPSTPNLGDMTKIAARVRAGEVEAPEILVGGTPCQAFSVAGMRAGLNDPRGELTIKYVELADAVDDVRRYRGEPEAVIVWENVPGVLSDRGNAFGCFLGALAGESCALEPAGGKWSDAGCVYGPKRAIAWRILDAQYFGLAQRRRRVFLVASARPGFDPASVLFEREGVRRDTPPSREARQGASASAQRGADGGSSAGHLTALAVMAHGQAGAEIRTDGGAPCLTCNHEAPIVVHGTQDSCPSVGLAHALGRNSGGQVAVCVTGEITHALKAEGFDASEYGTGRGQPIVPWHEQGAGSYIAPAEVGPCMGSSGPPYSRTGNERTEADALACTTSPPMQVRRLIPMECERLQGFPDGYTAIPWRGRSADECPDGPRYKALGNSKAVPVVRWIGRRIAQALYGRH